MSINLKLLSIVFILIITIAIFLITRKGRISLKYSIIWYGCLLILFILTMFPSLLVWFTNLFGIQISSNFIFAFMIGVLFVICISLTVIVSEQNEKIRCLIQELSILKQKMGFNNSDIH